MMARRLGAVARELEGRLIGRDCDFGAVSTDTRSIEPGALFVALVGERFDGHRFVPDARKLGAAGALVSRLSEAPLPQVEVRDTRLALGHMARAWRGNFALPVIAVTGSAGKTTVKELIAKILSLSREVCVTQGNLNNDIGVPLTLMRLRAEHAALVVELGANHGGEIDYLAGLVEPTVGVITNAGAAHLEGFGSLAGVVAAKGELLDHLPRAGTAVLNADDPHCADWSARAPTEFVTTFGFDPSADCRVVGDVAGSAQGSHFAMRLPDGENVDVFLPLLGRSNVVNALAAAAAAQAVGVSPEHIVAGLAGAAAVPGRMTALRGIGGATVIDDSYNANPASVRAALDYLDGLPGQRIFVLGDMAELGEDSARLHGEIGGYARGRCDRLLATGALTEHAVEAFGERASHFAELGALQAELVHRMTAETTVLIKGSRVMGLERLAAALLDTQAGGSG